MFFAQCSIVKDASQIDFDAAEAEAKKAGDEASAAAIYAQHGCDEETAAQLAARQFGTFRGGTIDTSPPAN